MRFIGIFAIVLGVMFVGNAIFDMHVLFARLLMAAGAGLLILWGFLTLKRNMR
jgi:hypothetical protein